MPLNSQLLTADLRLRRGGAVETIFDSELTWQAPQFHKSRSKRMSRNDGVRCDRITKYQSSYYGE